MKFQRIVQLFLAVAVGLSLLCGCGGGNKDLNGSLSVEKTETDSTASVKADFTVQYSNPDTTNVLGTEIDVTIQEYNLQTGQEIYKTSFQYSCSNSGKDVYGYTLVKRGYSYAFRFQAVTGDLKSYQTVIVPAATLTATPASVDFYIDNNVNDEIDVILGGGDMPYKIFSKTHTDIFDSYIESNILKVKLKSKPESKVSASIFVGFSSATTGSLQIPVTFNNVSSSSK
jgi:hypothetical protein